MLDKIQETKTWLESKIEGQSAKRLDEEPAFLVTEAETKMKSVGKLFKKVSEKKKPKEKKKVEVKDEEKAESDAETGKEGEEGQS